MSDFSGINENYADAPATTAANTKPEDFDDLPF
jgi:protein involved in sex pheromone biosynthesis